MESVFTQKLTRPAEEDIKKALGMTYPLWNTLEEYVKKEYPAALEEWNYSEKFGWSFRMRDKKRVLVYFLPRDNFFKIALVFGQKATEVILKSTVSQTIISEIKMAKVYAEGRGIRIDVKNKTVLNDLKKLISIKITNGFPEISELAN